MEFYKTIGEMLISTARNYHTKTAYKYKDNGNWISISHQDLLDKATALAKSLIDLGFVKGDRIGIVSENRIEWIISDMACAFVGIVDVPVFPILTPSQLHYIFDNCSAKGVFVSNSFQYNKIKSVKNELPELEHIICYGEIESDEVDSFNKLINNELKNDAKARLHEIEKLNAQVDPKDLLTIIYTSGTTGHPKGVMLTNDNLIEDMKGALNTGAFYGFEYSLSYLPFCHAYERLAGYYTIYSLGIEIALAESIESIPSNIKEIKPEVMTTVPKLMETIKKKVFLMMEQEKLVKRQVFNWAIKVGKTYLERKRLNKLGPFIKIQYSMAEKLVYSKIKQRLGGRMKMMIAGGAALADDVNEFFALIGITTVQGYGLTETSPAVCFTRPHNNEIGTVGEPFDNIEVKIADDGEILIKGPIVMKGYYNDEEATSEAIKDGWFHTGDIGIITERGNIKITDRKKNIFVSSGGKNIAPQPVENSLKESRYVDQIVMFGDGEEFCSALIYPDYFRLKELANKNGIDFKDEKELADNEKINRLVKSDLNHLQSQFSKFEKVRKIALLKEPLSIEKGELTPKMSFRRHVIKENYQDLLNKLYS